MRFRVELVVFLVSLKAEMQVLPPENLRCFVCISRECQTGRLDLVDIYLHISVTVGKASCPFQGGSFSPSAGYFCLFVLQTRWFPQAHGLCHSSPNEWKSGEEIESG